MNVHSSSEKGGWCVDAVWSFHKKEYLISCNAKNDLLTLEVEEQLTADRWKAQFEAKHIEELTRKTGNFKKFPIFLNMLKSAITRASESVCLDLLTYEDLEHMWDKKLGPLGRRGGQQHSPVPSSKSQAKRYLILTYNVEFDRIHYPLALTYCGQPDPRVLQDVIRKLQAELDTFKKQTLHNYRSSSVIQLQKENALLIQEKEQLEEEVVSLRQELLSSDRNESSKEIQVLKKVVKNLEEEVLKEHSKYQKSINKKNEELRELLQEMEDLRMSERVLRSRVKNLMNELSLCKKGSGTVSLKKTSYQRSRTNSSEKGFVRGRKLSSESRPATLRLRTPSPYRSGRGGRFDPTAYVEEKRRERSLLARAKNEKPKVSLRTTRSRSSSLERSHPPLQRRLSGSSHKSLSVASQRRVFSRDPSPSYCKKNSRSRESSVERLMDRVAYPHSRESSVNRPQRQLEDSSLSWDSLEQSEQLNGRKRQFVTRDKACLDNKESQFQRSKNSQEISEIDARLMALQDFMKRSLENTRIVSK